MSENQDKSEYISTSQAADMLNISRVAVFKRIKSGKLKAEKVGRNYIIKRSDLNKNNSSTKLKLSKKTKKELESLGVSVVYFFGSRVANRYLDFSDIDIGLVFKDKDKLYKNSSDLFLKAFNILSSSIETNKKDIDLDISLLQKANPALRIKAINEGRILFESNPIDRADFEENTFREYNDYIFLQNQFRDANIKAFS